MLFNSLEQSILGRYLSGAAISDIINEYQSEGNEAQNSQFELFINQLIDKYLTFYFGG